MRTYTGWALDTVYTHVCADEAIHEAVHVVLLVSVHMFKLMHLQPFKPLAQRTLE